ncbi:hypothetical protein [Desulfovibrio psychrotolerans]|uniref:Uncharacterized protein n=1 Tax=Desulfovibrio psychrotolerans TaxID=415242 RepID=A0A7J0BUH8_9BACT|nr:hypothetical protein [Desulfovibrio psychrotolerans]GFM37367.1 hypothetical protein DSM19430T_20510 [Desulfovibrio psychrotolerans]
MGRKLSPEFITDLKNGNLTPVLKRVRDDHTLDLQIRDNEIHIYYRGGKLVGIKRNNNTNSYKMDFDKNYLKDPSYFVNLPYDVSSMNDAQRWVNDFQFLKLEMDIHFSKNMKPEREFQQLVSRENSYSRVSNLTDYFIVDVEFEKTVNTISTKFDAMAIYWPSTSSARKFIESPSQKLAIIEVKYSDSALSGSSGIVEHMEKTVACLREPGDCEEIKITICEQFNQKRELGLVLFSKNGNKNAVPELSGRPIYILLLANHDPASKVLRNELNSDAFNQAYMALQQYADVKFATSSFMGYGLFEECMLDLDSFKSALGRQAGA